MKFKLFTSLVFCIFGNINLAQNSGTIRGNVKDKNTQETIIGAIVVLDGTNLNATTDVDGNYKISVPADGGVHDRTDSGEDPAAQQVERDIP